MDIPQQFVFTSFLAKTKRNSEIVGFSATRADNGPSGIIFFSGRGVLGGVSGWVGWGCINICFVCGVCTSGSYSCSAI